MSKIFISHASLYEPAWVDESGGLVRGHDEDTVTLGVAAALPIIRDGVQVEAIYLVSSKPVFLDGSSEAVLNSALGLIDCPVFELVGSEAVLLTVIGKASPGDLIIAVENEKNAFSGAVFINDSNGVAVKLLVNKVASLPVVTRKSGESRTRDYGDSRLQRDVGTIPLLDHLKDSVISMGSTLTFLTGIDQALVKKFGVAGEISNKRCSVGVPAPIQAVLDCVLLGITCKIAAISKANGSVIEVSPASKVKTFIDSTKIKTICVEKTTEEKSLPISLAAYSRSFSSKVGRLAKKCLCGEVSFPPKFLCGNCGSSDVGSIVPLGHDAEVYTMTKICVDVPGKQSPYVVAVVDTGSGVKELVSVTELTGRPMAIGSQGTLVLRVIAEREGIPDYGYSFRLEED
jgi:uncharacterized OB-fold protein